MVDEEVATLGNAEWHGRGLNKGGTLTVLHRLTQVRGREKIRVNSFLTPGQHGPPPAVAAAIGSFRV